jgi:hypothetical protein
MRHLTTDTDFGTQLNAYKGSISKSEGISDSYGYYPIIFVDEKAYSGLAKRLRRNIKDVGRLISYKDISDSMPYPPYLSFIAPLLPYFDIILPN